MFLFLREGTQSQSSRDDMRARGLSPSAMQMGDVVACDRGEGGPSRPSMINFLTGGLDRF
jgi:hypothetical protein